MLYSFKIEKAIRAAGILHHGQTRKGRAAYPYITHLFSVAMILADYTKDEDIIVAGLLHDTLEDTDYTEKELASDFGEKVCEIVVGVTEPPAKNNTKRTWKEAKLAYVSNLEFAPRESLMVAAADKIHNLRSIVEEYALDPKNFNKDFRGTNKDRLEIFSKLHAVLNAHLDDPIVDEYNEVFAQYQKFLNT